MKRLLIVSPYVFLGIVGLLLRVLNLNQLIHTDEVNFWYPRSHQFLTALQNGQWAATAISTHPGVTTMWLGSLGILVHRASLALGMPDPSFTTEMGFLRLPVVLVHTLAILVGYAAMRRLFSTWVAWFGALLWAVCPFTTAFSRLLHVDGLTGTFATLALLGASCAWHGAEKPQTGWLVLSGISAALAMVSKSTGMAVGPLILGIAILAAYDHRAHPRWWHMHVVYPLFLWGGALFATLVMVWPAVWAAPQTVYTLLRVGVEVEGGSRHVVPNYFLGRPDPAPGWLYYPVVLALRTTPWTLIGIFGLPWVLRLPHLVRSPRTIAVLAGFIIVFTVGLSPFAKKLDRYLVAVFPALNILAALGLVGMTKWIARYCGQARLKFALIPLLSLVAIANALWWHPYGMAYFNPMLGGIRTGIATFLIGEGEGLGEAAAWLNAQPDITGVTITSTMERTLQAALRRGAQVVAARGDQLDPSCGYVVIYIRHMQRWGNAAPPPYDRFYQRVPPLHVVRIHGIDYVHIYHVPRPLPHLVEANFGTGLHLHSYHLDTSTVRASGRITLTLQWQARAPITEDPTLFVHVVNRHGERMGQIDVPPAGPQQLPTSWPLHRYLLWNHPIPLSPTLPAGDYWLALGLYRQQDFSRLPLMTPSPPPADGPRGNWEQTLLLGPFRISS